MDPARSDKLHSRLWRGAGKRATKWLVETIREHATTWLLTGLIIALTGVAPKEWFARALRSVHISEDALHLWGAHVDLRVAIVFAGVAIIVGNVLWRYHGQRLAVPEGASPLAPADVQPAANAGPDDRRSSPEALPLPDKPSIAVLPFQNMSGDPEQEYFADGIVEEILTALCHMRSLFVIARNSSFIYKGRAVDVKQVGRELGVRYVLEGSVRKSSSRVRVTAQLIEADTGHHLVAEKYDRSLSDLFELQDEIASTIAGAIEPELLKFERNRIASRPEQNLDAYDLYQRGMWHHYRHSKDNNIEAQRHFRRALAIDPHYPQATAALGLAICNSAIWNWSNDPEQCYAEAFELAQRAITLDPPDPAAHFVMGLVCMWTSRFDRSVAEMKEAIKLNPSFAAAHCILGHMHVYAGHPEEAIPLVEKGMRLSPSDPRLFMWLPALAAAHYQLRHYEEAIEVGRNAWSLNRNWRAGLLNVVAGLGQLGRIEEAQAALVDLEKLGANLGFVEGTLKRLYRDRVSVDHFLEGLRKAGLE